jgi:hypothetical protein
VVEEELGVEGSKTTFHTGGTSGWEDVKDKDEDLARLEDVENGHRFEDRAVITISNFLILLKILLTVSRILNLFRSASFKPDGRRPHVPALAFLNVYKMSIF